MSRLLPLLLALLAAPVCAGDVAVALQVARSALSDGLAGVAERHYREVLDDAAAPQTDRSAAALGLAEALSRQDRADQVLAVAEQAATLAATDADRARAAYWRAWARWRLRQPAQALDALQGVEEALPEGAERMEALHLRRAARRTAAMGTKPPRHCAACWRRRPTRSRARRSNSRRRGCS